MKKFEKFVKSVISNSMNFVILALDSKSAIPKLPITHFCPKLCKNVFFRESSAPGHVDLAQFGLIIWNFVKSVNFNSTNFDILTLDSKLAIPKLPITHFCPKWCKNVFFRESGAPGHVDLAQFGLIIFKKILILLNPSILILQISTFWLWIQN